MFYKMQLLKEDLLLIRWQAEALEGYKAQTDYLTDFRAYLDAATQPIYVISDLRYGKITDVRILQQLGRLTYHPNYGAGVAFSDDIGAEIYVGVFSRFAARPKREENVHSSLSKALAYLETFKAGISEGVDWEGVLTH